MKITNDDVWQEIKSGNLRGLSIEGYFTNKFEEMQKQQPTPEQILSALNEIIREAKTELKAEKVELTSIKMIEAIIKDGKNIFKQGKKFSEEKDALVKKAKKINAEAKALTNGLIKELKEFEKQAKELGVKTSSIPQIKEAINLTGALDTVIVQTKSIL